jgi:hypothetical protein
MKLFERFAAVILLVAAVTAGADSAWATTHDVKVIPTLESTGTNLTLEYSFYEDGQKVNAFEAFGEEGRADLNRYTGIPLTIRTPDGVPLYTEFHPQAGQTHYDVDKVVAQYILETPLVSGNYLIYLNGSFACSVGP